MKKAFLTLFIPLFFILSSCGSTAKDSIAQSPENAEQALQQTEETVANSIAEELNSVTAEEREQGQDESKNKEEVSESEKVSEEDSILNRERDSAPTTDEKEKISEYQIFEEPVLVVFDNPAEEPPIEEKASEEKPIEEKASEEKTTEEKLSESEKEISNTPLPKIQRGPDTQTQAAPRKTIAHTVNTVEKNPESQAEQKSALPEEKPVEAAQKTEEKPKETRQETEKEAEPETEPIVPSRSTKVKINQYLDVTYPGTGWVYIGETEKSPLFNYSGRKIGTANTTFSLRAKKSGTTMLHFYKNDALTGEYIDDYLEVTVENKKAMGRVKAPSYAAIVPAKPQRRIDRATGILLQEQAQSRTDATSSQEESKATNNEKQTEKKESNDKKTVDAENNTSTTKTETNQPAKAESDIKTVIQTTDEKKTDQPGNLQKENESTDYTPTSSASVHTNDSEEIQGEPIVINEEQVQNVDESLLEKALKDFADKQYELALSEAELYYNNASTRLDEALYLLGQIWESDSSVRNVRSSVDSYDTLTKQFPTSKLWQNAKNRSIYLKRFYIDIR
ncbi:MAG: hypothetical protein IJ530_09810 [Treponema sp.]|uniref:hypothetical protein n=1 Tax=Treponema sp. TaxID=166 RepID=UPI001C15208B|nr:hypothetical protein [Treponema sp.]MBQ8680043.1 hypothetical protein [Treponema sp.]MBR1535563.1 hypothetical protein [Treponema sp.]